jgi:SAM-dependent methyltransferase
VSKTFISHRTEQFSYFDTQLGHPDWTGKRVLDFGGNVGNFLWSRGNRVKPENYWSIDISWDAIRVGRRAHRGAHFVFYDRYNFQFNPSGVVGLPIPDPGVRFDLALAFSVFTHTTKAEMLELVAQLRDLLVPGGTLAFTFLDPNWVAPYPRLTDGEDPPGSTNLHWGLLRRREHNPELDVDRMLALAAAQPKLDWVTLSPASRGGPGRTRRRRRPVARGRGR